MDDGSKKFLARFKLPNANLKNTIEATPDDFKEFQAMEKIVFDFFEELAGKSVNRDKMSEHLTHYFEEGFSEDEIKDYIRASMNEDFFKLNPVRFTIANLFPLRDPERVNMTWDKLSYFQGLRLKPKKKLGMFMILRCGEEITVNDVDAYTQHQSECFQKNGKCFAQASEKGK